jgi:hypothetical protein
METSEQQLRLDAKWTDDCQGKKDYDGPILSISTRYWPRGGSALIFDSNRPELGLHKPDRPDIKPSATSSLVINYSDADGDSDYLKLIEKDFEAETQEEVQAQVEAWAQEQMDRTVTLLRKEFGA